MQPMQPDPTASAFAVRGLTKVYGDKAVVDHLNLDVPRGSIYGIAGPNGAGKTTMLGMATGLIRPTEGDAYIWGHNMWTDPIAAKSAMGLLVDDLPVFDRLSATELLSYVGALRGMDPAVVQQRSAELLDALGLADTGTKQVVDFSAGMTKKMLLALALLHRPDVLVLDEPLEAVDPVSGRVIQQILRSFAASGGTVVLSSHVMELVEGLCDHVAIIDHGKVLVAGHVDEVRQGQSLSDIFVSYVGGGTLDEGSLAWLHSEQQGNGGGQS